MRQKSLVLALGFLVVATTASAQDPDKKVNWQIGAGYTWTLSEVGDYLGDGYNFDFGVTYQATPTFGIEGLYAFNGLGTKDFTHIDVSGIQTPYSADMNMQYGTASVVFQSPSTAKVRPYGLTGVGIYYRPVTLTTPSVGFVPGFCSPYWYYCSPGGLVPVDEVIGDRSSTDFGMVFGGGISFSVSDAASVFVELRYHYIWGPKFGEDLPADVQTITGTDTRNANGQFMPLTFGIKF